MVFRTLEDVDSWVAAKNPGAADKLREPIDTGQMTGQRAVVAKAWLARHERRQAGTVQTLAQDLAKRQTVASELAAAAAQDSSRTADKAFRWSVVAAIMAAASAIAAVVTLAHLT